MILRALLDLEHLSNRRTSMVIQAMSFVTLPYKCLKKEKDTPNLM